VIGFVPNVDLNMMHIYRIKGRDWMCSPFSVDYDAKACYVGGMKNEFQEAHAVFADGDKGLSLLSGMPFVDDDMDDVSVGDGM